MPLLREPDFGTPSRLGAPCVSVTIDGVAIDVAPGTSVMRAARENGIDIPKLCATDNLEAYGSCRLCVVEIDGARGLPASCTTPVSDGMVVATQTERIARFPRPRVRRVPTHACQNRRGQVAHDRDHVLKDKSHPVGALIGDINAITA